MNGRRIVNLSAKIAPAGLVGDLYQRLSERRALRWRRLPELATGPPAGEPTTYYLCPDYPVPSGGIRAIYRHVDLLTAAGRQAAVLHHSDGFRCPWFESATPVVGAPSVRLSSADTLVVPEIYGPFLDALPRVPRLVSFNQNAYLTFEHVGAGAKPDYGIFAAAMAVSEDNAELLRFVYPDLDVRVVPNSIDPDLFAPAPAPPPRRLGLMPRKRPLEADLILRLLDRRLGGWEVVRIEGASEREVAETLRSLPIFLALGLREGFGLPAAEAMASGCFVVGFAGYGGREIFDPGCSAPIEDGDVLAAARALADAMDRYEADPEDLRQAGARAAARTSERYGPSHQREALLAFFDRLG